MSSLEVTPNLTTEKRGTILTRSSSFQKLKCSATYQFHLAGSILSKESLTQLFEKVITHSRTLIHVAFVVLALPTFKLFTMVMIWSLDLMAKIFGLNLVIENQSSAKLQTAESGFLVRIRRTDTNIKSPFDVPTCKNDDDSIENRLKPDVPEIIECNPLKKISKFPKFNKEVKQNGYLSICVYGCVAFAYIQFVTLVVALNVSSTPPGLIFLTLSLFLIGYIIFKIFLKSIPNQSKATSPKPLKPTSLERFRISRSTTRRYLEFHEKTLSKIKLL